MSSLVQKLKDGSKELFTEIQKVRRHLHQHPELSFQEFETSAFLKEQLQKWKLKVDAEWVKTGFTVLIDSGKEGPCIGLRADLDALPIQEKNNSEYCSKNDGIMHACGHDVHSSCLLGAGILLEQNKSDWSGKVVLIFQAGEEKLPGGAKLMMDEGLLEKYAFDQVIAQHVYPEMEVGNVGFKTGMYMASADEIYISIKGKGGHGALPHRNIDPVIISAEILLALQQISSRFAPPTLPFVLSFGKVTANGATNVIPDQVDLEGTMRTMDEEWRAKFHQEIERICTGICKSRGAEAVVNIAKGYPCLINDENLTIQKWDAAKSYMGEKNTEELPLRMTAEDFAYFSQKLPVCFYRLGVGNEEKGIVHSVHHPQFDIDEKALEIGMGLMAFLAMEASQ